MGWDFSVYVPSIAKRPLNPGDYLLEQILTLQVRTRLTIGKLPALAGPGLMNCASGPHLPIT